MSESEKVQPTPESSPNPQHSVERLETLEKEIDKKSERFDDSERKAESAKAEAMENAISVEAKNSSEKETQSPQTSPARGRGPIAKKHLNKSYRQTLKRVQSEMPLGQRTFSKVIHNKVIESSSEIVGATIARPNAILAGSVAAFALTLFVYVISKSNGYAISGFETIGSFIIGWIIGIVFDYFRVLVTGGKN